MNIDDAGVFPLFAFLQEIRKREIGRSWEECECPGLTKSVMQRDVFDELRRISLASVE